MIDIGSDSDLLAFLELSAAEAGTSVQDLLRQVLHVDTLSKDPRFGLLFASLTGDALARLMKLDRRVRIMNAGLHYVFRSTYLGYRREVGVSQSGASERSQIFLSLVPRIEQVRVFLPLHPSAYVDNPDCRDVTHHGHHGVGDLQVDLADGVALDRFFITFHNWLRPPTDPLHAR